MHDMVLKLLRPFPFTIQLLIHGITFKISKGFASLQIKKNSKLDFEFYSTCTLLI